MLCVFCRYFMKGYGKMQLLWLCFVLFFFFPYVPFLVLWYVDIFLMLSFCEITTSVS